MSTIILVTLSIFSCTLVLSVEGLECLAPSGRMTLNPAMQGSLEVRFGYVEDYYPQPIITFLGLFTTLLDIDIVIAY